MKTGDDWLNMQRKLLGSELAWKRWVASAEFFLCFLLGRTWFQRSRDGLLHSQLKLVLKLQAL